MSKNELAEHVFIFLVSMLFAVLSILYFIEPLHPGSWLLFIGLGFFWYFMSKCVDILVIFAYEYIFKKEK